MITCELRRLLKNEVVPVTIPKDIEKVFNVWKEKFNTVSDNGISELDVFYAGYILANPVLREQYLGIVH